VAETPALTKPFVARNPGENRSAVSALYVELQLEKETTQAEGVKRSFATT
jgi:hypothetical protein